MEWQFCICLTLINVAQVRGAWCDHEMFSAGTRETSVSSHSRFARTLCEIAIAEGQRGGEEGESDFLFRLKNMR
jgi:hypothetical protein